VNGPGLWGEWVHNTPIFPSFPLHLEVSNLPFLIEFGDFTFLEILFFLNLEYTWTFISPFGFPSHGKLRSLKIPQVLLV
jgi:hypothetical protein